MKIMKALSNISLVFCILCTIGLLYFLIGAMTFAGWGLEFKYIRTELISCFSLAIATGAIFIGAEKYISNRLD